MGGDAIAVFQASYVSQLSGLTNIDCFPPFILLSVNNTLNESLRQALKLAYFVLIQDVGTRASSAWQAEEEKGFHPFPRVCFNSNYIVVHVNQNIDFKMFSVPNFLICKIECQNHSYMCVWLAVYGCLTDWDDQRPGLAGYQGLTLLLSS